MDERKVHAQRIGDVGCSFRSSGVWRDNHASFCSAVVGEDLVLDVLP